MRMREVERYSAILYHGSPEQFDTFDFDRITSQGPFGNGFYLTNDIGLARQYANGGEPMRVRVVLQKPYWLDLDGDRDLRKPFRSAEGKASLIADGYDGVVAYQGRYIEVVAYRGAELSLVR